MSIYICPVCGENLEFQNKNYKCKNNHSFDISAKGSVNLLLSNTSRLHGDNKLMIQARREFLNKGYYKKLSDEINNIIINILDKNTNITGIDAGCGEGYYTAALANSLKTKGFDFSLYGFDISKDGIKYASSCKDAHFAVASLFNMPVKSESADFLLNIFSPFCDNEYARVLKKNGILLSVIPGGRHLYSVKEILYDTPYENDEAEYSMKSFDLNEKIRVKYGICLESGEDIKALFSMTPYYYRTSPERAERLYKTEKLETELDFIICRYSRKKGSNE